MIAQGAPHKILLGVASIPLAFFQEFIPEKVIPESLPFWGFKGFIFWISSCRVICCTFKRLETLNTSLYVVGVYWWALFAARLLSIWGEIIIEVRRTFRSRD